MTTGHPPKKDYKHYVFKASRHLIEALTALDLEDTVQLKRQLTMAAAAAQEAKFRLRRHNRESKRDNIDHQLDELRTNDAADDASECGQRCGAA